jgi:predicted HTH domain antitoxin
MSRIYAPTDAAGPPHQRVADPLISFREQLEAYVSTLNFVYDDLDGWLTELATDVLQLPVEQRFTRSRDVFEDHLDQEFGSMDAFRAQLPQLNSERAREFAEGVLDRLLRQTLEQVWYVHDPEPSLLLSVGFVNVKYGIEHLPTLDAKAGAVVFSSVLSYFARLYDVVESGEADDYSNEILWRDTARLIYHVERAVDGESETIDDPEAEDLTHLKAEIRQLGAVIAYSRLDISVGRGAELAGVSRSAFRELLAQSGVAPRFGPSDADELFDGALGSEESNDDSA